MSSQPDPSQRARPTERSTDEEVRQYAQRLRQSEPNAHAHKVHLSASVDAGSYVIATVHWLQPGQPVTRERITPA